MKIICWNVNSLRVRLERISALLERHTPDVLCLQETKVTDELFPKDVFVEKGYHCAFFGQKTYNGVCIISREPLSDVRHGFPDNPVADQARVISARLGSLPIVNAYVINGKTAGSEAYQQKLIWLDALTAWLKATYDPSQPLVVVGDFNIAPDDRDVHDPERWKDQTLCTDQERDRLATLCDWGLIDLFRRQHADDKVFSWWDYRHGAFHRGWGLRIDLILASATLAERCTATSIDRDERKASSGPGNPSDHAPVIAEFTL